MNKSGVHHIILIQTLYKIQLLVLHSVLFTIPVIKSTQIVCNFLKCPKYRYRRHLGHFSHKKSQRQYQAPI